MESPKKVTIVFSVYNEYESLKLLSERLKAIVPKLDRPVELIFVDDGSSDDSAYEIRHFRDNHGLNDCQVRMIRFSRNFGHEAAMIAGIDHATGGAIICMDADMQHPPELVPQMIEKFERGYEIVTMVRESNIGVSKLASFFSRQFYNLINALSPEKLHENASDFFLISGNVANILRTDFRERNRFLRGIIQIIGFRNATIEFEAPARVAGVTKYPVRKLVSLTVHAVTSFSKAPLFLGIWFGFLFGLLAVVMAIYTLWVFLFGNAPPSGYTTIVLLISISFSILFFLIGIIGIYVGFLFEEQKKRPLYLIEEMD